MRLENKITVNAIFNEKEYKGIEIFFKKEEGTSLVVQWLRLHAPNVGGPGLIPGQGTRSRILATKKIPHPSTKDAACCNEDSCMPQLKPGTAK